MWFRLVLALGSSFALACKLGQEGIPEGKLAVVGPAVFGPEDLAGVQAQLGAYAQIRFRGEAGSVALLDALIDAELLAQEAVDAGIGDDPRVHWAQLEEVAELARAAAAERTVPRQSIAEDVGVLRAYYGEHIAEFTRPQRRSAAGVLVATWEEADRRLDALVQGQATLEEFGEIVRTPLQSRDDGEFPGFHPVLFSPQLQAGQWLPEPVIIGEKLLVGRVDQVEPAAAESFEDPSVRERVVAGVRRPLIDEALRARQNELAASFPEL